MTHHRRELGTPVARTTSAYWQELPWFASGAPSDAHCDLKVIEAGDKVAVLARYGQNDSIEMHGLVQRRSERTCEGPCFEEPETGMVCNGVGPSQIDRVLVLPFGEVPDSMTLEYSGNGSRLDKKSRDTVRVVLRRKNEDVVETRMRITYRSVCGQEPGRACCVPPSQTVLQLCYWSEPKGNLDSLSKFRLTPGPE